MDIMMPELNGIEAARAIRDREKTSLQKAKIFAVSSMKEEDVWEKCKAAGVDVYITKPLSEEKLIKAMIKQVQEEQL